MIRLRELREERGWNMSEAAKQFNLPYTTYVSYEKGARQPGFDLVCQMAEFYNVSVTWLMGTSDVRGMFPKHDENDLLDPDFADAAEAERQKFITLYEGAPAWLQTQVRSLLEAAESDREAQGGGPKDE